MLATIELNTPSRSELSPELEGERISAITDLLRENVFTVNDFVDGPYKLLISLIEGRFRFEISDLKGTEKSEITVPYQSIRGLMRDYVMVCESYYEAVKLANSSRLEAIDMGRRGLHNEAAEKLTELLLPKVSINFQTARRLFTLLFVAHMKSSPSRL